MASSSKRPGIAAKESILTPVMTLEGHESYIISSADGNREFKDVSCISYFPDGKQMISGSHDKTIRRWDLREGKEIKEAREVCESRISAVGVSRDGRWVVTAGWELKVSEVETGIVRTFHEGNRINCIDISTDSTLLAGSSNIGSAWIWNLDTGKLVAGPFKSSDDLDFVGALRFLADSRKLALTRSNLRKQCLQVWDVQAQKLVVARESISWPWVIPLVFWTTKHKSIVSTFNLTSDDCAATIYELDASRLKTVGDPFQGHTSIIRGLALSFDCVLLASASDDNTIKLWSFESRQLLASFDVQAPDFLILSPDSCQLAYTAKDETKIYVCNIPANILASIGLARETSRDLAKLLNSDATRHAVRRKPPISVISPVPRPLTQPIFLGFLRKLLHSSRTDAVHPIRTNEPRNLLDFPATASLPRPLVNPHENFRITPALPTTQSSALASTTFKSRLSTLWPLQTDHASPAIVDVPLTQAKERNAAAGAPRKDDEWIPDEDHVSTPPSPNPDSQQQTTTGQIKTNAAEHGSSQPYFCF